MDSPTPDGATTAHAAAATRSGLQLGLPAGGWRHPGLELLESARTTAAWAQLTRCFAGWPALDRNLSPAALRRLAANRPVDPNHPATWQDQSAHAAAVLRRHGITRVDAWALTDEAQRLLAERQAEADRRAGLDWTVITPPDGVDERLRRARAVSVIDLDDPAVWRYPDAQRRALARRHRLDPVLAEQLSRWAVAHGSAFDAGALRCWRVGSPRWIELVEALLPPVGDVERPVGVFVVPAEDLAGARESGGWQLVPVLSLNMLRLIAALGGTLSRGLTSAWLPGAAIPKFIRRVHAGALHAGPRELIDSRRQLGAELTRTLGVSVTPGPLDDPVDRWARVVVHRSRYTAADGTARDELHLTVRTTPGRGFPQRRLGSAGEQRVQPSAVMELGEAVGTAVERGLPVLLSAEAASQLDGRVRVGRMRGRPGLLTITEADGASARTERLVVEQAVPRVRALRARGASVVVDAGARQALRMVLARPLADDPVLLGRQREVAALMVVGSGVNASQVGTGKTVVSARAVYHRAARTARFRCLVVAEGRLLAQWRGELTHGAPARGLPPLAPNVTVAVIDERTATAGQLRRLDSELGDRAGLALVPNGLLDRYPTELCALDWHLLIADEALRYANPATQAHRALARVRAAAADCWLLTATPRGRTAEHLDVLVGLALGDEAMIAERLATREAGDLADERTAHRLRVHYGPHLVRVTRHDLRAWLPDVRPAQPLAIEPDGALTDLLEAIRRGGREAYRRLLELLAELKTMNSGSELHQRALAEIARVQGMVLGNVGVYVDASIDPETLLHSRAALAQALSRSGLVAAAMRGGGDGLPLLRGVVAQTLAGVAGEEQVLVFAERVRCLRQLADTLTDRHGVEAHVADGSITEARFEELKRRFLAGQFPVLCLSRVGQEGHNLQNASVIVHLDLPWLHTVLEQRVGRAARPGSTRDYVQTYIPYVTGAGIEHVVSVLTPRGAEHHQILDSFEGVAASESTIATQLGQISAQVADSKDAAGHAATAAKLRVAASVFGAEQADSGGRPASASGAASAA